MGRSIMCANNMAIVNFSLLWISNGRVGYRYLNKALRCMKVSGIVIWVMSFRQAVKFSVTGVRDVWKASQAYILLLNSTRRCVRL